MFIMYCIYGESRSSLLIESTNSMIINFDKRVESSLLNYIYSINYIALQLLLWLALLYTSSKLVFQIVLSLLVF